MTTHPDISENRSSENSHSENSRSENSSSFEQQVLTRLEQLSTGVVGLSTQFNSLTHRVDTLSTRVDTLSTQVDTLSTDVEEVSKGFTKIENEQEGFNDRFNDYQRATQWVVQLAFTLIASATLTVIVTSVLRR